MRNWILWEEHRCHNCSIEVGRAIPHWGESPCPSLGPRPRSGPAVARGPWGHRVLVITTEIGTANCSYYLPFGRRRAVMRDRSADNITTTRHSSSVIPILTGLWAANESSCSSDLSERMLGRLADCDMTRWRMGGGVRRLGRMSLVSQSFDQSTINRRLYLTVFILSGGKLNNLCQ